MPNTPKGKTSSPKRQGSRSKRPNTHVTFESYQSLLFLDSKEILLLFNTNRRMLLLQGKKAVGVCGNPNTLNENYNSLGGTYLINLHYPNLTECQKF